MSGADGLRAFEEQRDGVGLDHRRQIELDLARDSQRLAARREDSQRGGGREQLGDRPGGVRQQLLEVVQDDVRLLVAEAGRDGCGVSPEAPRCGSDERHHERGIAHGASGTKTVPPSASSARNRASSIEKRVLPVPPGPTMVSRRGSRSSQASQRRRARARVRESAWPEWGGRRRRACGVAGSPGAELEQLCRAVEVLQAVATEIAQRLIVDERGGRGREDHLAAVGEGRNAGAAVDVDPDVALRGDARRAGVEAHPNRDRPRRERILAGGRSGDGAGSGWERDEEGIALRVDLDTPLGGERVTQHPAVIGERVRVPGGAELPQEAGRALDVGEQQGDGPRRQCAVACRSIPQVSRATG